MISYLELGATLFIPASHKALATIVSGEKYPNLRSLVIDFEDGLDDADLFRSTGNLESVLQTLTQKSPYVFIRAKDDKHLEELLKMAFITNINGFVLAKFSLSNAKAYLELLSTTNFLIMPSIEGKELFHHQELHKLKEIILTNKEKILLVRFGLEDMLRQLSMRRTCDKSVFDISATAAVVGNFIATFKSAGFGVSGGVYPCYKEKEGFIKDVKCDMQEGLFTKTIIHPSQIEVINELYKVDKKEYEEALAIVNAEGKVFALNGKMAESITMCSYSKGLLLRAKIYGFRN